MHRAGPHRQGGTGHGRQDRRTERTDRKTGKESLQLLYSAGCIRAGVVAFFPRPQQGPGLASQLIGFRSVRLTRDRVISQFLSTVAVAGCGLAELNDRAVLCPRLTVPPPLGTVRDHSVLIFTLCGNQQWAVGWGWG